MINDSPYSKFKEVRDTKAPIDSTIFCNQCGGSIPVAAIECMYCGTKHDPDLSKLKYETETTKSGLQCSDCEVELESLDLGVGAKFIVERCGECYGMYLEKLELEEILKWADCYASEADNLRLAELLSCPDRARGQFNYRQCPVCDKLMTRKNFGRRSGVILDTCHAHGTWLDAGELNQLMKWAQAGGKHSQCYIEDSKVRNEMKRIKNALEAEKLKHVDRHRLF